MIPPAREAASNRWALDAALDRLSAHDSVDGLAMFGSHAGGAALPASDYDLLTNP